MNLNLNTPPSRISWEKRDTWWIWIGGIAFLTFGGIELAILRIDESLHVLSILLVILGVILSYWLIHTGRRLAGIVLFMAAIGIQTVTAPLAHSGLGLPIAVTTLAVVGGMSLGVIPRRHAGRVFLTGLILSLTAVLMEVFGSSSRPAAGLGVLPWAISVVVLALLFVLFAGEYLLLDLRTKIITAILGTGGLALSILILFGIYQAAKTTNSLTTRLNMSVRQLAEEQLVNTALIEANLANQEFENIAEAVAGLAQNWVSLLNQKEALSQVPYWDARVNLRQFADGQYGNAVTDPSSVFIRTGISLDELLIADLNLSAYLDFSAPAILQERPTLLAVYAIDTRGVTRYYPNIDLASILPADFDTTQRPYFSIASPLFNPQRIPRWTIPYEDATGGGLVVTVAAPVYQGEDFVGVIAADMQLSQITEQIKSIKVGETGYAFMLDDAGRILSMPKAGFDMFGLREGDLRSDAFFKHTLLGVGSDELQSATMRMTAGGNGLLTVDVGGVDTYISFFPVKTNGYSIALVVPVSELQGAITAARSETQQQIQSALSLAATLLLLLLVFAVGVSIGLGRVIAAPIRRLTQIASLISAGDLGVQAPVTTSDEIGTLASAFNTMTFRLRETLEGLEKRVAERTAELSAANERNERRAKQFEAIAQIARTISSTGDLDILLSQITDSINRELGFYHVGIFLLDPAREYAVLGAANSAGGRKMLERSHRLKVGETGLVGYVTGTGKARVALETGTDSVFFNNPDLPETRSELALPLRVGNEIIGALDVQSTEPKAFLQEDISILSILADQVSIAIQNARQFEATRKALNESEVLSKQFVQTGWQRYTKSRDLLGIRHSGARASILYRRNGKDQREASSASDLFKPMVRGVSISLPIKLRGEVIGSVDVRMPDNRRWDQDEMDIVTAIIERAAIALENARLLEESQKRAAKEQIIGEISSKISMQSEINELLKTAAQELGRSLPGAEVAIQFNKDAP